MLDRIDEPNVLVHLDTYHMNVEEKGFYEPLVSLGTRPGYVHLSGDIDYGALAMESFAAVNEALIGATALWRDVVEDPYALVRDGLAFLRAKGKDHGVLA
jgi:D-psicose/D-tagatose/L-ribulose 3-epimerase